MKNGNAHTPAALPGEGPPSHGRAAYDEQLRFMAELLPQKIIMVTPAGAIDYINSQWYEYTGYEVTSLEDKNWGNIVHPDDAIATQQAWAHTLQTMDPLLVEHRLRRRDGVYRWHLSQASVMRSPDGEAIKWFGSSTDIHDSRLARIREQRLTTRTKNLAREREKLLSLNAAKDEFISLASHQLRTPATAVKQYLSMTLDGYAGDITQDVRTILEKANASNDRQIDIVDDLLEVARVDAGKVDLIKTEVNLVPLAQEVINEYSALLDDRLQAATLSYSEPGISAQIDRQRLKMVLENILDNASKYSAEHTTITFHISRDAHHATIDVTDQGVGIAPQDKTKLFGKFTRLDNPLSISVGGSGLGLYWAKRIVRLHKGKITVSSVVGKGSTFSIVLPLVGK